MSAAHTHHKHDVPALRISLLSNLFLKFLHALVCSHSSLEQQHGKSGVSSGDETREKFANANVRSSMCAFVLIKLLDMGESGVPARGVWLWVLLVSISESVLAREG